MINESDLRNCITEFFKYNCTEEFEPEFAKYWYGRDISNKPMITDMIPINKYLVIIPYPIKHPFLELHGSLLSKQIKKKFKSFLTVHSSQNAQINSPFKSMLFVVIFEVERSFHYNFVFQYNFMYGSKLAIYSPVDVLESMRINLEKLYTNYDIELPTIENEYKKSVIKNN